MAVAAVLVAGLVPNTVATAQDAAPRRLAGADRFGTAATIAAAAFPNGSQVVYLARADVVSDAVAAGTLRDGPVLLVHPVGTVPAPTREAILRLDPSQVIALGGPRAVSAQVLADAADGRTTGRVAGPDRYATSVAISQRAFPGGAPSVFLTHGEVDPLTAGTLTNGPILLLPAPTGLDAPIPDVTRREIERLAPRQVVRIGGRVFAPYQLVDVSARDRIGTSLAVALFGFGKLGVPRVYLASADNPVDAIAAGALTDGPIVLVRGCGPLDARIRETVLRLDPAEVVALGGPRAICDAVLDEVRELVRTPLPGPLSTDRWLTDTTNPARPGAGPTVWDVAELHGWAANGRYVLARTGTGLALQLVRLDAVTGEATVISEPAPWTFEFRETEETMFIVHPRDPYASLSADGETAYVPARDEDTRAVLAIDVASGDLRVATSGRPRHINGRSAVFNDRVVDLADGSGWPLPSEEFASAARDASWVASTTTIWFRDGTSEPVLADGGHALLSPDRRRAFTGDAIIERGTGRRATLPELSLADGFTRFSDDGSRLLIGVEREPIFDLLFPLYDRLDAPAAPDGPRWPGGPVLDADQRVVVVIDVEAALAQGGTVSAEHISVLDGSRNWPDVWWAAFDPTDASRIAYEAVQSRTIPDLPRAAVLLRES